MPATGGGPNSIGSNIFYVGYTKQSTWGTAVAPTVFSHWLDGTDAEPNLGVKTEREGDTSPFMTLAYKQRQMWELKIVEYLRPITFGYVLQALMGTGSDAYTAPSQTTTLSSPITVGANSFITVASIGNTGTGYFNFTPALAGATYEVQNVNLAGRTGTGPYTYPLQSGTFAFTHNSGDTVNNNSQHIFTRQTSTYDAYCMEVAFGNSTFGVARRVVNCVCTSLKATSAVGMPVKLESTWVGSFSAIQAALSAITGLEGTGLVGSAGAPLTHFMAGSTWNVDGEGAGIKNGAAIKSFEITLKNGTAPEDFQSEQLYAPYFIPGTFDISGQMTVIFEDYSQYNNTYYGNPAATSALNSNDSYIVGYGSFAATWAPINNPGSTDGINSVALAMPLVGYTAAKLAAPKRDGKALNQQVVFYAQRTPSVTTPITITLNNSSAVSY